MFSWFRRPKVAAAVSARNSSLFSTEITAESLRHFVWTDVLKKSFQRGPEDFTPRAADGSVIPADQIPTEVSNIGIGTFAMDAPSEGNPLSMKPLLQPIESIPYAQLCWYAAQGFVGYQICAMISQHWLIDKACTIPARDAIRHGYEIGTEDDEEIDPKVLAYIKKRDKQLRIRDNCVEFVRFNRVFGIRICLPIIETNDPSYWQNPFNPDGITPGSYKGMSQIDPYWITPELDFQSGANPASMHFYEPTWWRVNGKRIHRSHLVIIRNGQVADILKPTYLYGGISVPQKIAERVYAAERTANEAPQLALTKRTTLMKMDVSQALANINTFQQKMQFFSETRDNYGVKTIGLDDEAEQFDTSLSDFDDTIMTQYQIVAAASDIPTAKLMGTSPKGGLGSEGDYDTDSYHEFLESIQMNDMQPLIERHHLLLMRSEVIPKFGNLVPQDFEPVIVWNATDTPSAKEQAEINYIKSQTGQQLVTSGAIDGTDERARLIADKDSGYNGMPDIVPGGPGDREAQQAIEAAALEKPDDGST